MDSRVELSLCLVAQVACWLMPTYVNTGKAEHLAYLTIAAGLGIHSVNRGLIQDRQDSLKRVQDAAEREVELHHLATRAAWQQRQVESAYFPSAPDGAAIIDGGTLQNPEDMTQFDTELLRDIDECPLVAIIGKPGRGKSTLAIWIATSFMPGANIHAYDTDCKPEDWPGIPVYGRRGQFSEIGEQMLADLELLAARTDLRGRGMDYGGPEVRIIEEYPTTAADLDGMKEYKGLAPEWLGRIVRRGRKYRIRPILVSQNWNVKALKIEGDGELRDSFTVFHLGPAAFRAIKREVDRSRRAALYQFLQSARRACVVEHDGQFWPWIVPELGPDDLFDARTNEQEPVETVADSYPIRGAKAGPETSEAPEVVTPPDVVDVREHLERLRSLNAHGYPREEEGGPRPRPVILSQEEAMIVAAAKEKGGAVSVREAMRSKGLTRLTSEQMLNLFRAIERHGLASVRTDPAYPNRYVLSLHGDT